MRRFAALVAVLLAVTAHAQAVIDPGMSKAQVIARLGTPIAERATGSQTYLFYKNGAERRAGMHDVVILDGDKVVDALFRGTAHRYAGKSSSPVEISAATARAEGRRHPPAAPGAALAPPAARGAALPSPTPASATVLPAEKAQQADVARPMPPAGSGERNARKAAAAAAAKASADSAAAAKKPADPKAAPPKKP